TRSPDDENVFILRSTNLNRFEREVSNLKPGDTADLRVYYDNQYRNVKVTVGRMSDLPQHARRLTVIGDGNGQFPMTMSIDGREIGDQIRRGLETAGVATRSALDGVGRALGRMGNRVEW